MFKFIKKLRSIVGKEFVITDEVLLNLYSFSASQLSGKVRAIVFPETADEVSEIVRVCYRDNVYIYPQASATELVGSAIPFDGIVISFERMQKILEKNVDDLYITVEPGLRIDDLNKILESDRVFFPVDPSSAKSASIGGIINTGGAGMKSLKYGPVRDWILELEVVLPDSEGTILNLGCKTRKCRQGYDLVRLIVGSEGTLALVTKATLRVMPIPENTLIMTMFFNSFKDLVNTVIELRRKITPLFMEFLDAKIVEITRQVYNHNYQGHMLTIGLDIPIEVEEKYVKFIKEVAYKYNVQDLEYTSTSRSRELKSIEVRRTSYVATLRIAKESAGKDAIIITEDVAVPLSRLSILVDEVEELARKFNIPVILSGHIGDGNLHPKTWFNPNDERSRENVWKFLKEMIKLVIKLNGTLSAEHGIGLIKKELLVEELKARNSVKALNLMKDIKRVFDPKGILNPGKIL